MPSTPTCRIAVIADVHLGANHPGSARRGDIADILLERAVRRINALIRPDVVLVLGDLVDDGDGPQAAGQMQELKRILGKLSCPFITLPGNHDGDPEAFYSVIPRPDRWVDVGGVRFLPFVDKEEPGYNATRSESDLNRIREARVGFDGPLVSLQHVCLFPPEQSVAPYNYTNAEEVIAALQEAGAVLSVSGHHHHGGEDTHAGGITFVNAPGLCESPFPLLEITLGDDGVTTTRHELKMPESLGLVDNHIHTQLAYCSENMSVERTIALAKTFGLAGVTLTEHAGQLYYARKPYWANAWLSHGMAGADPRDNRMPEYRALKQIHEDDFARFSLEVECDWQGQPLITPDDETTFRPMLGVVHALPGFGTEAPPTEDDVKAFLFQISSLGKAGMAALGHPMRIFTRNGWETPEELYVETARHLSRHGMAAEINFHGNTPSVHLVRACLEADVKFTFGSDAHNLAEVGDFACHIDLLRRAGYNGDLRDVMVDWAKK